MKKQLKYFSTFRTTDKMLNYGGHASDAGSDAHPQTPFSALTIQF